jgi:hypothetical protein
MGEGVQGKIAILVSVKGKGMVGMGFTSARPITCVYIRER